LNPLRNSSCLLRPFSLFRDLPRSHFSDQLVHRPAVVWHSNLLLIEHAGGWAGVTRMVTACQVKKKRSLYGLTLERRETKP
jgi:hypothetical protein